MNLPDTNFSHATVERLGDYELPDPPPHATPSAAQFQDPSGEDNFALAWWLWMDEMGKGMLRQYDNWRELYLGPPAGRPPHDR